MFCFFSLFDKYSMREIDETEIETWKRILLLSIVLLERVRLLHFNYHSIRFLYENIHLMIYIYSWKSLSHHSGNHFPFSLLYLNESVLLQETDDLTKVNKTLSSHQQCAHAHQIILSIFSFSFFLHNHYEELKCPMKRTWCADNE
jgi:hypothetical protein